MTIPGAIEKICCQCGIDVSKVKRTKDPQGRYYCEPCRLNLVAAREGAPIAPPPPLPPPHSSNLRMSIPPPLPESHFNPTNPPAGISNLRTIAIRQRQLNLAVLALLISGGIAIVCLIASQTSLALYVMLPIVGIAYVTYIVFICRLAMTFYEMGIVIGVTIASFIVPFVGVIALLYISSRATKLMGQYNIPVGLLGPDPRRIPAEYGRN